MSNAVTLTRKPNFAKTCEAITEVLHAKTKAKDNNFTSLMLEIHRTVPSDANKRSDRDSIVWDSPGRHSSAYEIPG